MVPLSSGASTASSPTSAGLGVQPRRAPCASPFAQWLFQVLTPVLERVLCFQQNLISCFTQRPGDGVPQFPLPAFTHVVSVLILPASASHQWNESPSPPKPNAPPVLWTPSPPRSLGPCFPFIPSHLGLFTFLRLLASSKQLIDVLGKL